MNVLEWLRESFKRVERVDLSKRFELINQLGLGSMSKVYRARDFRSGQTVALKILDIEKTKRFESRFSPKLKKPSEGEIAVTLKHPRIVKTYEHGLTTKNEPFLVMEFLEGRPLLGHIEAPTQEYIERRLTLIIEIGEAIDYFHSRNWIHRDICPRNVIIERDWSAKLIDFGLVVPNTPPFQAPGNRTGTSNYMAPELIKRQRTDQRIDIFSYAVTAYEALSGRLPWDKANSLEAVLQHINTPPADLAELVRPEEKDVAEVIMRGLAVYPGDRWQTMSEFLEPLREIRARRSGSH